MSKHFLLRVGDGVNFINSSDSFIWGVKSRNKSFVNTIHEGDKMWFIRNKVRGDIELGKVIAVADFVYSNKRIVGPLVAVTTTSEELGWSGEQGGFCDIEIHYII